MENSCENSGLLGLMSCIPQEPQGEVAGYYLLHLKESFLEHVDFEVPITLATDSREVVPACPESPQLLLSPHRRHSFNKKSSPSSPIKHRKTSPLFAMVDMLSPLTVKENKILTDLQRVPILVYKTPTGKVREWSPSDLFQKRNHELDAMRISEEEYFEPFKRFLEDVERYSGSEMREYFCEAFNQQGFLDVGQSLVAWLLNKGTLLQNALPQVNQDIRFPVGRYFSLEQGLVTMHEIIAYKAISHRDSESDEMKTTALPFYVDATLEIGFSQEKQSITLSMKDVQFLFETEEHNIAFEELIFIPATTRVAARVSAGLSHLASGWGILGRLVETLPQDESIYLTDQLTTECDRPLSSEFRDFAGKTKLVKNNSPFQAAIMASPALSSIATASILKPTPPNSAVFSAASSVFAPAPETPLSNQTMLFRLTINTGSNDTDMLSMSMGSTSCESPEVSPASNTDTKSVIFDRPSLK